MGMFITFEGIDGCGKSTQMILLHKNLKEHGFPVISTREPGGTPISEKIRNIILGVENSEMCARCELLLYLAARAQHVEEKIYPEMKRGKIVLSDRYEEATFVYQGFGRQMGLESIIPINAYATENLIPDITFIIDISLEESEKRFNLSGKLRDRLESNDKNFFNRVRRGYQERAITNPRNNIILLNGEISVEELEQTIFNNVLKRIKNKVLYHIDE